MCLVFLYSVEENLDWKHSMEWVKEGFRPSSPGDCSREEIALDASLDGDHGRD